MRQIINTLPRPTFRWLRINHRETEVLDVKGVGHGITMTGDAVGSLPAHAPLIQPEYEGVNASVLENILQTTSAYEIVAEEKESKSVKIEVHLTPEHASEAFRLRVRAGAYSHVSIYVVEKDDQVKAGAFHSLFEIVAGEGAVVEIKKVQLFSHNVQHIENRYTEIGEHAKVIFTQLELGGSENMYHFHTHMEGKESVLEHNMAYLGTESQYFDIAMLMKHSGEKSNCAVKNIGALTGTSRKSFKGTLDFVKGCSGSVGEEEDICLLLNDKVKSISLPLLLCNEENVMGNHAASAGQMDHSTLFYLMSRGFSEDEAKEILVESMIRPVIDLLGDEAAEEALAYIRAAL